MTFSDPAREDFGTVLLGKPIEHAESGRKLLKAGDIYPVCDLRLEMLKYRTEKMCSAISVSP